MITLSTALLVAIFISLVKPLIELFIKPENPSHDSVIRLLAIVSAIVGTVAYTYSTGGIATGVILWQTLGTGLQAGLASIFSYHAVSGDFFSTPQPPPNPALGKGQVTKLTPEMLQHTDTTQPNPTITPELRPPLRRAL